MSTATTTAPQTHRAPQRAGALTGLGTLLRFNLRRDRVRLPVWILGTVLATVSTAVSYESIYPTAADRAAALLTINNPGTTALIGAVYGDGDYTYGIMVGHQLVALISVLAALMSIFTLVRHTRLEEETGRAELVRASVVGRHAGTVAAVTVVVGANVVLALLLAVGLGSLGIDTVTWEGSLLFGAAIGAVGLVFAGVAAVSVQLTENARTASSIAGLTLAAAYVLRAIGDVGEGWISWLSPIGWSQATETYDSNSWAPLGISLAAAVLLLGVAVPLSRRRDVGAGLFGTRPGPASAGGLLGSPLGLAVRLLRGTVIGWGLALFLFGIMYGPVLSEADTFLEDLPIMAEFLPDIGDATGAELFGATVLAVAAILAAVPAVQIALRLRAEETAGRAGPLLATPVSRVRWVGAYLTVAVVGGAVVLLALGLGMGLGAGWSLSDMSWVGAAVGAALSYLPATAVLVGVAALLFGVAPRAAGWAWAPLGFAVVVMYFGGLLDFPQWLIDVSPYAHVPQQPAAAFDLAPLLWLTGIAAVLVAAGLAGVRRRDVLDA
ncbi:ABC transporter permease [Georgenia sunbinii]|uniref:ABC transporter permease n=1 Tax=Georgenia sunbinii TaxID=3117728 RepID=UPI002F2620D0